MTETPTNPEAGSPDDAADSVQQQLDRLLHEIETQEPGTIDPSLLPPSFQRKAEEPAPPPETGATDENEMAEAMADFEQAIEPAEAEAEPEVDHEASAETDMLAQLNAALKDLQTTSPAEDDTAPQETATATAEAADAPNSEETLQAEINALLSDPPADAAPPAAEPEPVDAPAEPTTSTEDQLATEIANLLESQPEPTPTTKPDQDDPSIDELDRMLADEIDEDEELAGDFESVESITAGIDTGQNEATELIDEHAASARDVAAELDSQPEDQAAQAEADTVEASTAHLSASDEFEQQISLRERLERAKDMLLRVCFAINWPARRYLSAEWRANIGYIALLNLFVGVAVWIYVIFL